MMSTDKFFELYAPSDEPRPEHEVIIGHSPAAGAACHRKNTAKKLAWDCRVRVRDRVGDTFLFQRQCVVVINVLLLRMHGF